MNEKVELIDVQDLAASICGIKSNDESIIDSAIQEKYGVDIEQYERIVTDLVERIDIAVSPLTEKVYIGFSDKKNGIWFIKKNISNRFINTVIEWLTNGQKLGPKDKGFSRVVTNNKKPEFEIIIKRTNA